MRVRLVVSIPLVLLAATAWAQTSFMWSGGPSGSWETAINWTPQGVPGTVLGDSAAIPNGASVTLSASPAHALSSLSITGGSNLTLLGSTWTLDVTQSPGSVVVGDGSTAGTLTMDDDNTPNGGITVAGKTVTISSNGLVRADGAGAAGGPDVGGNGAGPGGGGCGPGVGVLCAGGGYGGEGGATKDNFPLGEAYGSLLAPTDIGSGGGSNSNTGGRGTAGGGRIRLVVSGLLSHNGFISAGGLPTTGGDYDGAGSGGSIWISAGSLAGAGGVQANGGVAFVGGGGGGGRIAIDGYSGSVGFALSARGGAGWVNNNMFTAAAGTIALTPLGGGTSVTIDNAGQLNSVSATPLTHFVAKDLTVTGQANIRMSATEELSLTGTFTVPVGQTVRVQTYPGTGLWGGVLRIRAATIQILGALQASGAGFAGGRNGNGLGPGGGSGSGGGSAAAGGGGHGGNGGAKPVEASPGPSYGSPGAPVDMGSGGGGSPAVAGAVGAPGGGAVRLFASGMLTVDGTITVDGAGAWSPRCGGGAGGAIYLTGSSIQGSGTLSAAGGAGDVSVSGHEGGGGAGGRVTLYADTPSPSLSLSVMGGSSTFAGEAGSVTQLAGGSLIHLDAPANEAAGTGEFVWSGFSLPPGGSYALYVDDDDHLGPSEPTASHPETGEAGRVVSTTNSNAVVPGLTAGRTYFWHLEALTSGGAVVGGSAIQSFVACSGSCNVPPQFLSSPNGYGQCGLPYHYSAAGVPSVAGGTPFQFSVNVGPGDPPISGLTVLPATGEFQWTPTKQDEGLHHLQLTVIGPGGTATQAFDLVVACPDSTATKVGCACNTSGVPLSWVAALLLVWTWFQRSSRSAGL